MLQSLTFIDELLDCVSLFFFGADSGPDEFDSIFGAK